MLFQAVLTYVWLAASANAAVIPVRKSTELQARDISDALSGIISFAEGILQDLPPDVAAPIESFVASLIAPSAGTGSDPLASASAAATATAASIFDGGLFAPPSVTDIATAATVSGAFPTDVVASATAASIFDGGLFAPPSVTDIATAATVSAAFPTDVVASATAASIDDGGLFAPPSATDIATAATGAFGFPTDSFDPSVPVPTSF